MARMISAIYEASERHAGECRRAAPADGTRRRPVATARFERDGTLYG